jgi:hypothetical protein
MLFLLLFLLLLLLLVVVVVVVVHVRWVPCHYGMVRLQVADGGDGLQIWRVTANILNKQSRTADKGWGWG